MDLAQGTSLPNWYSQCVARLMHLWFLKASGTMAFMAIFFYGYFAVQRSAVGAVTIMSVTWVDDWIAFWPPAFYLYASLWIYTSLVPALQASLLRLVVYGCAIGALCLFGLVIFSLFPTAVPYATSDWFADPSLSLLRSLDLAGNACPSLHVATAVFSALCLRRLLGELGAPAWARAGNWVWCTLIVYSTLAIKQHVLWDVLAGVVLALVFSALYRQLEARLAD